MSLACGLVGLPNAGKSTLFRALTAAPADIAPYPFTTIAPGVGVMPIPDARLEEIARVAAPDRVVPATIEIVDIAGLVRNAHRGEGLGNQFLGRIREVDAIVHVVRCFGGHVAHVEGGLAPIRDIEIVETELLMADLETVQRARADVGPRARTGAPAARDEDAALAPLEAHLAAGRPARTFSTVEGAVGRLHLLSSRPVLYVANLDEGDASPAARPGGPAQSGGGTAGGPCLEAVARRAKEEGAGALGLCARLELELSELDPAQAAEFLDSLGLKERGLPRLARACLDLLRLRTFFSIASREVRAWTVPAGTRAAGAAGRIHTDMERGFIRAEVVAARDLAASGSLAAARERGLVRLEGRAYEVQDGDVITFRFAA
ncbi:MAG TPA: redox-regulated ATPase YchF [bacterium]|nr:redox-regulated ATPase YchF [bacterium]